MPANPPIIYIHCHDAGRLIQPHGHTISTPELQRFADESIFFRQAYCVAPTCSPSRAALLTGRYPHQVGMLGLAHRGFLLNNYADHLGQRLQREGYTTALSGVQHVAPFQGYKEMIGYNEDFTIPEKNRRGIPHDEIDRRHAQAAASYIEKNAATPFYLECGFFYPHRPYPTAVSKPEGNTTPPPPYLPDTSETRADIAAYATAMQAGDAAFGIVFDALRRAGLWDRAIIIATTDHGPAFPWAKCNLNDQGTGVFLMMRLPGQHTPVQTDTMVTHMDIRPTIMEILGLPPEPQAEGKSLLPLLNNPHAKLHDELFSEVTYHAAYEPMRSIRTARHRYTRRFDTEWSSPVLPNIDPGPSKDLLLKSGLRETILAPETLYDLTLDPAENHNLITDPTYADVLSDLKSRLEAWMKRTNDPLLNGPVPAPPGAIVTPKEDLCYEKK